MKKGMPNAKCQIPNPPAPPFTLRARGPHGPEAKGGLRE